MKRPIQDEFNSINYVIKNEGQQLGSYKDD